MNKPAATKPAATKSSGSKKQSSKVRNKNVLRKNRVFWLQQISIGLTIVLLLFTLVAVSIVYFPTIDTTEVAPELQTPSQVPLYPESVPSAERDPEPRAGDHPDPIPTSGKRESRANWLVFVVDDAGYNLDQLQVFLESPAPLTIAVLPHLPYSAEAAKRTYASSKEVIVHMPMEALNGELNPGPGAIFLGDSPDVIREKTIAAFSSVPYARGANNHMGSAITRNADSMGVFFDTLRELHDDLVFLDSRTGNESIGLIQSGVAGVNAVERDIFLDNEDTRLAIIAAIEEAKQVSSRQGHAVMIGHVWSEHLGGIITELYPELMQEGFHIATLTELINYLSEPNR